MELNPDDVERYCRDIEAYLCRKNDGHLIRIVGPAFEQVCGWSNQGIPLKVALRGIDRYFDRYYAKGPRRRPVRVEFCEPDVLDAFDEWRRALGVTAGVTAEDPDPGQGGGRGRRASLPSHLDRTIARLTSLRTEDFGLRSLIDTVVRELDSSRTNAKGLRGEARGALVTRLRLLDAELLEAARSECDAATMETFGREADAELGVFRERMAPEAYEKSRRACVDRLVRERLRLPVVSFDG